MRRRPVAPLALAVAICSILCLFRPAAARAQTSSGLDDALGMTLEELEEEIARREADLQRYSSRLAELDQQNEALRADLEQREATARARERSLRTRIVGLCRLTRGGYVALLLGAHTWTDLLRRAELARSVVDRDVEALRAHRVELEQLRQQRRTLAEQLETQRTLADRISLYQQELEAERQRRVTLETPPPLPTDESLGFGIEPGA
jgi:peptidoglycan hydrolase CwlO-like protein